MKRLFYFCTVIIFSLLILFVSCSDDVAKNVIIKSDTNNASNDIILNFSGVWVGNISCNDIKNKTEKNGTAYLYIDEKYSGYLFINFDNENEVSKFELRFFTELDNSLSVVYEDEIFYNIKYNLSSSTFSFSFFDKGGAFI